MLKTETNTPKMERRILRAAKEALVPYRARRQLSATFEHGGWWIARRETGARWVVNDSCGSTGFDFKQVTPGDEVEAMTTTRLLTAAQDLLKRLDSMTTDDFARGGEKVEREALRAAVRKTEREG